MKSRNQYKFNEYGDIKGVTGERFIKNIPFDRFDIRVVITKTIKDSYGESYFNIYFIDEKFKIEPLNNLQENIPLEDKPKKWKDYLLKQLCEYVIWRDYNYNVYIKELEDNSI